MRSDDPERLLTAILRNDLMAFCEKSFHYLLPAQKLGRHWYIQAIAFQLERCLRGEIRRLIITIPPRHTKSLFASVALPAFILGHDPTARIICASYSQDLAARHARDCRQIMNSPWYHRAFPGTRLSRLRNADTEFLTTMNGFRMATSVGGTLTGFGGNWMIVDDAQKADEALSEAKRNGAIAWFDGSMSTRLDNKSTDVIIVVMQRLHAEDLVGHLLSKGEGWVHLNLPAIAEIDEDIPIGPGKFHHRKVGEVLSPDREPLSVLEDLRRQLGNFAFSAQYQQRPIPVEGEIIKWSWFQPYDELPTRALRAFQSWDTAQKDGELNDYSVCTTWMVHNNNYYLIDLYREKLLYPELKRTVIELQRRFMAGTILIEDKGAGTSLIQDLRASGCPSNMIAIVPDGEKTLRVSRHSIAIESGRVFLPRKAEWLPDLRSEVVQFPAGRHDDQVDSMTQFIGWAETVRTRARAQIVRVTGI